MLATAEWVHWAGTIRPHSAIGMPTPAEHETARAPIDFADPLGHPPSRRNPHRPQHPNRALKTVQLRPDGTGKLITSMRAPAERANALIKHFKALRHVTISPTAITAAALVILTLHKGFW